MTVCLRFRLNHEDVEIHVRDPASTLLDVLRDDLGPHGYEVGLRHRLLRGLHGHRRR